MNIAVPKTKTPKKKKSLADVEPRLLTCNNPDMSIATLPIEFVILTFPYKEVNRNVFKRQSTREGLQLIMTTNYQEDEEGKEFSYGLPFGIYPRLLFYHICSEVKRTKNPLIKFGKTFTDVLKNIQIIKDGKSIGGQRRAEIKDQFMRFAKCSIEVKAISTKGKRRTTLETNLSLVRGIKFWEEGAEAGNFEIEVTKDFFEYILTSNATIFDAGLLPYLKASPLLMDLYIFLNLQAYNATTFNNDIFISFEVLYEQFGSQSNPREFKRLIKGNLEKLIVINQNLYATYGHRNGVDGIFINKESRPSIENYSENQLELIL